MEIFGSWVGWKLCCMNIQYLGVVDEWRVVYGNVMEGVEIIFVIYLLIQVVSGIQRMRNG